MNMEEQTRRGRRLRRTERKGRVQSAHAQLYSSSTKHRNNGWPDWASALQRRRPEAGTSPAQHSQAQTHTLIHTNTKICVCVCMCVCVCTLHPLNSLCSDTPK